jgi:septum site-determining protein MinD
VLLITSGKGGTGKSTVSHLLGRALARRSKNVLLVELDSGLRGLDLMLGVSDRVVYDLSDVLEGRCRPAKAVTPIDTKVGNLHLIAAPIDRFFVPDEKNLRLLLKGLSGCYDFLILDTAAGLGQGFDIAARVADEALIVATPDPVSVRDAAKTAQSLPCPARLVVNKFTVRSLTKELPDLDAVIDCAGVRLISVIPNDDAVAASTALGVEPPAHSPVCGEMDDLAGRLLGERIFLNTRRLK